MRNAKMAAMYQDASRRCANSAMRAIHLNSWCNRDGFDYERDKYFTRIIADQNNANDMARLARYWMGVED